jgi:UPF0148 protein
MSLSPIGARVPLGWSHTFRALHKAFQQRLLSRSTMPLDDRELEQISKMLERGGKMLADHCETCQSPLFKFEDKLTCPVCSYRAIQTPVQESERAKPVATQPAQPARSPTSRLLLDEAIAEFVSNLASKMSTETDLARIHMQLECIERGLRIIQLARGIDSPVNNARLDE